MTSDMGARPGVKWTAFALIGGCAVCCAVPIFAAVGLTGAVASFWAVLAYAEEWSLYAIAGIAVTGALIYLSQRRRESTGGGRAKCETSCSVDQSCCRSSANRTGGKVAATCSLPLDQLSERGKQFQALFANAFVRSERIGESVVWYLRKLPEIEMESRRLAALETTCCSALRFDVSVDEQHVVWRITGPTSARALLDLFGQLPMLVLTDSVTTRA
jgi:hypothetical protein